MAQGIAEVTSTVTPPTVSQQSASQTTPSYMRRRVNIPGPNLGFPVILTFNPKTVTATTSGQFNIQIPGGMRPIAAGWYSNGAGGASVVRVVRATALAGTASGSSSAIGSQPAGSAGITVSTDTYGIAYRKDTSQTYVVISAVVATGSDTLGKNDPEWTPTGDASPRAHLELRFASASTVADFSFWVMCIPTRHCNSLSSSD